MINKQKELSPKKGTKFNDYKVSPIWAVVTIVFTLAILINSGILIYNSRILTIQSDSNKIFKEDLKNKENIFTVGLQVSNDEYSENFLKSILSDSKLRALAKTFWSYEFFANNKKITSSNINVSKDSVEFSLVQTEKERILPYSLHILGSLTAGDNADRFYEHPIFHSNSNYTLTPPLANTNPAIAIYKFKDTMVGETITISLTPPLRERLDLVNTQNQINVIVK